MVMIVAPKTGTIYTDAENASQELESRKDLLRAVEEWFIKNHFGLPPITVIDRPAVLARQIATCRYEDLIFDNMAKKANLTPVWLEYSGDRASSQSPYKRSLLHPTFCTGIGKRSGQLILKKEKLANIQEWDSIPLNQVQGINGQSLMDFHHQQLKAHIPEAVILDNTAWVKNIGGARQYYVPYLTMFVAHSVLFEDYEGGESGKELDSFTEQVFLPAREEVIRLFGKHPLIVPLPWWNGLQFYPTKVSSNQHIVFPKNTGC